MVLRKKMVQVGESELTGCGILLAGEKDVECNG